MAQIYLAEIQAYDPSLPGVVTLRYSSGQGYNQPSAPAFYDPRLKEPGQIARSMFASRTTLGAVETSIGELSLVNQDGLLDPLKDYGVDGRVLKLLIGDSDATYSSFTTVFTGTMLGTRCTEAVVQFLIRDRLFELDKPLLTTTYAGTNSLPNGVEGVNDIKGRVKPRTYGVVKDVAPPVVNTARLIYQISDTALSAVNAVYDNFIALTAGAAYVSQVDMETTAPAAGQYRAWLAGGMIRLGATPVGQITVDATQGAAASDRTTAQIIKALALAAGIAGADIAAADVTALDTANSAETGTWISDERTTRQAAEEIATSAGAWFGFDRLGKFRMGRLEVPSGTPVATLKRLRLETLAEVDTIDLLNMALVTGNDSDRGLPTYRVTLEYARCYSPVPDATDAAISATRRAFISNEYRKTVAEDTSVKTAYLLAPEVKITTLLALESAGQTEAARQLAMRKIKRDRVTASVRMDASAASLLDINVVVRLTVSRWGFLAGKLFRVIGLTSRLGAGVIDLELWG